MTVRLRCFLLSKNNKLYYQQTLSFNSNCSPVVNSNKILFRKNNACALVNQTRSSFWEKHPKAEYSQPIKESRLKLIRDGFKQLKSEIILWKKEAQEVWEWDPVLVFRPGEIDKVWDFKNAKTLDDWVTTSDRDHGQGYSSCEFSLTSDGGAIFSGNLCTEVPKDGKIKKAGYCNIKCLRPRKSFKRDSFFEWAPYTYIVFRVRGDGRSYMVNLQTMGYFDIAWNDMYQYVLYTRGGPYWQVTKIPFSKFFLASKGRIQDKQCPIIQNKITSVGITVGDKVNGPFQLEIDYIGLEFDPTYTEEFAYEMYQLPKNLAGH